MTVRISPCDIDEFGSAVKLINQEFLASRGRTGTIEERFPAAVRRSSPDCIVAARIGNTIASVLVVRRFVTELQTSAAMLGMVCTQAQYRGRGLASALLKTTCETLASEGRQFAVLWTTSPDFYARLGWLPCDMACVASITGDGDAAYAGEFSEASIVRASSIREKCSPHAFKRSSDAWRTKPPHADTLEIFFEGAGYVFAGVQDNDGYIYELCGPPADWPALWQRIRKRYQRLMVNGRTTGNWERWLAHERGISWSPQTLSMYIPLRPTPHIDNELRNFYLPIPDRI